MTRAATRSSRATSASTGSRSRARTGPRRDGPCASTTAAARSSTLYFGVDGQPVLRKDFGAARLTSQYDERGYNSGQAYFGIDGRPVLRIDNGAARMAIRYDERGNDVEEAYFGVDGNPIANKEWGAARRTKRYDERGLQRRDDVLRPRGQAGAAQGSRAWPGSLPATTRAATRSRADFSVPDGRPMLNASWGAAGLTYRYDERGNVVEEAYFGIDGQPVLRKDWGVARVTYRLR